jgi:hypothetical protein
MGVYFENLTKQTDKLYDQNEKCECGKFRLRTDHEGPEKK